VIAGRADLAPFLQMIRVSKKTTCLIPTPQSGFESVAIDKYNPGARFAIVAYLRKFLSDSVNGTAKTVAFLTKR
jgi:hypothetical protein